MLRGRCAGSGAETRPLGGTVDTVKVVSATPVAFGHRAAAFCLPRMAALAGLADAAARGMRGDGMYGESVAGGCAVGIHARGGESCVVVGWDGVVIGAGEA